MAFCSFSYFLVFIFNLSRVYWFVFLAASLGISGVSPTMNPLMNLPMSQRSGEMINGGKIISNAITPREKESSVSEATVETTITGSPSEPPVDVFLGKKGTFYDTEHSIIHPLRYRMMELIDMLSSFVFCTSKSLLTND